MPERLTETLVRLEKLTQAQAEEALQRQVLLGGALDSSLLELELASEADIVAAMTSAYGLATASIQQVKMPPDERANRSFPEQWAKKHMLAPLNFDETQEVLSVLSPAPADVNLIVRLGELLEITLRPLLAPEFRVWQRLHILFGTEPPERFQNLIDQESAEPRTKNRRPGPDPSFDKPLWEALSFTEAVQQLREARDRDSIVQTALRYTIRELGFVAILINHDDHLEGWAALGPGSERVPHIKLPLEADSAFRVVLDTHSHYLGPLPADTVHASFLEQIGRKPPRAVLIVPWRIRNRTIALLYGDNETKTIAPRIAADLMLFTNHVQMALEALLVRKKAETLSQLRRQDSGDNRPVRVVTPPPTLEVMKSISAPDSEQVTEPPSIIEPAESEDTKRALEILPILPIGPDELLPDILGAPDTQPDPIPPPSESLDISIDISESAVESPEALAAKPQLQEFTEQLAHQEAPEPPEALPIPAPVFDDEPNDTSDFDWEPVQVSEDGDLGAALDRSIVEAQAALGDSIGLEPIDPAELSPSTPEVFEQAVLAESQDGQELLDELNELTHSLASVLDHTPYNPKPDSEPDIFVDDDGWESVSVNTWDEPSMQRPAPATFLDQVTPNKTETMRSSLTEDSTVPDMSTEAWIRASSEVMRPRSLPPEVMERAALPEEPDPVPLTRITVGKNELKPMEPGDLPPPPEDAWFENEILESDIDLALEEPVPLTQPRADSGSNGTANTVKLVALSPTSADPATIAQIESYLDQLEGLDSEQTDQASEALLRLGTSCLPALSQRFPGRLDVEPFGTEFDLPHFAHCGPLLSLFERFGRDAHPYVVPHLEAPEPRRRLFAIHFYGAVFVPEAIPRLIPRLHDEEIKISTLAVQTLFTYREHIGFNAVLEHIHGRLRATSSSARRHAIQLIGQFRDITAIPLLLKIVNQKEKPLLDVTEDALAEITKQRLGSARKWNNWWSKNQGRSRILWLIDGLSAKDDYIRLGSDTELRIITGLDMGYDSAAPKRQREEAKQRWLKWWNEQDHAEPSD